MLGHDPAARELDPRLALVESRPGARLHSADGRLEGLIAELQIGPRETQELLSGKQVDEPSSDARQRLDPLHLVFAAREGPGLGGRGVPRGTLSAKLDRLPELERHLRFPTATEAASAEDVLDED